MATKICQWDFANPRNQKFGRTSFSRRMSTYLDSRSILRSVLVLIPHGKRIQDVNCSVFAGLRRQKLCTHNLSNYETLEPAAVLKISKLGRFYVLLYNYRRKHEVFRRNSNLRHEPFLFEKEKENLKVLQLRQCIS